APTERSREHRARPQHRQNPRKYPQRSDQRQRNNRRRAPGKQQPAHHGRPKRAQSRRISTDYQKSTRSPEPGRPYAQQSHSSPTGRARQRIQLQNSSTTFGYLGWRLGGTRGQWRRTIYGKTLWLQL